MTATPGDARLGVVVVNYGSSRLIAENLGSTDWTGRAVLIVVVDNLSSAAERTSISELCAGRGFELVAQPDNRGYGAGTNAGLKRAAELGCDCFVLLNPDARIDAPTLLALGEYCRHNRTALVSPRLVTADKTVVFAGSQLFLDTGRIKRLVPPTDEGDEVVSSRAIGDGRPARAWLPGTCLALHRDLLARVGGFDEPYFLYWEDIDYSVRCADAGGSLVIRHHLTVEHDEGGTQQRHDSRALSPRYYFWNCRNRLVFAAQHLPRRAVWSWMLRTPTESWQILLRGGRRQLLRSPGPLWATVRGSAAGLLIAARRLVLGRRPEQTIPTIATAGPA